MDNASNVHGHTEASITAAIIKQFGGVRSQGEAVRYVVAAHVNNGAGFAFGRTLDAVVFDTWPSKGLALHGIEIKISKSDLRRELQHPDKSGQFIPYLDTFSIAAPKEVLEGMRDLIPGRWGIYTPTADGGLRTVRKPLYLHDDGRDRGVCDRSFAAAFARALVQRSLSREAEEAAYKRGYEDAEKQAATQVQNANYAREQLEERVKDFEKASGLSLGGYRNEGAAIGEAVKFVLAGGLDSKVRYVGDLRELGTRLIAFADQLDAPTQALTLEEKSA